MLTLLRLAVGVGIRGTTCHAKRSSDVTSANFYYAQPSGHVRLKNYVQIDISCEKRLLEMLSTYFPRRERYSRIGSKIRLEPDTMMTKFLCS